MDIDTSRAEQWLNFCPENSYRIAEPAEILTLLPDPLQTGYARKLNTSLVINKVGQIGQEQQSTATLIIADLHRIDKGGSVMDQDPYIIASVSGEASPRPSGAFLLHGDWPDRTFVPDWNSPNPNQVLSNIHQSGIHQYYPSGVIITKNAGNITELDNTIYQHTVDHILQEINPQWRP